MYLEGLWIVMISIRCRERDARIGLCVLEIPLIGHLFKVLFFDSWIQGRSLAF